MHEPSDYTHTRKEGEKKGRSFAVDGMKTDLMSETSTSSSKPGTSKTSDHGYPSEVSELEDDDIMPRKTSSSHSASIGGIKVETKSEEEIAETRRKRKTEVKNLSP